MNTETEPKIDNLNLDPKDEKKATGGGIPVALWLLAIVCVIGAFITYEKVSSRRVDPPPPPINVKSIAQVNQTLYRFIDFTIKDNWDEAKNMLTAEGQQKLAAANESLRDSLLASRKGKDQKVVNGGPTQEDPELGENSVSHNVVFYFAKGETLTVPLTVVKETVNGVDRLAISDWGAEPAPSPSASTAASPSPAVSKSN